MEAEQLLSLAGDVAAKRTVQAVLQTIVQGLALHPGVGLARIWLRRDGDMRFLFRARRISRSHAVSSSGRERWDPRHEVGPPHPRARRDVYYPGAPHGITPTRQDQVNAELLAFFKGRR